MKTVRQHVRIRPFGIKGLLALPDNPKGLIFLVHGNGRSRFTPRNHYVAEGLQQAGFATLVFDLLTEKESKDRMNVFNVFLLARRLVAVTHWVVSQKRLKDLPLGYWGPHTGAAAALFASTETDKAIGALVLCSGRPDLAMSVLKSVKTPTLFVLGEKDSDLIKLNNKAYMIMKCDKSMRFVAGASRSFKELGALDRLVKISSDWFSLHMKAKRKAA